MPANNMRITYNDGKTVFVNMNKITKYIQSKRGVEAAKRYENNRLQFDYWHSEDEDKLKEYARSSLKTVVDSLFGELSVEYRAALIAQIITDISDKIEDAKNLLKSAGLKDVGKISEKVIKDAMVRDEHLDIVKAIYNEAKNRGQKKLNSEQARTVEIELKEADAYNLSRSKHAQDRIDAIKENERIAKENGPKVFNAYKYLCGTSQTPSNK